MFSAIGSLSCPIPCMPKAISSRVIGCLHTFIWIERVREREREREKRWEEKEDAMKRDVRDKQEESGEDEEERDCMRREEKRGEEMEKMRG